eukprot:5033070-Amphidinium_carterae.1
MSLLPRTIVRLNVNSSVRDSYYSIALAVASRAATRIAFCSLLLVVACCSLFAPCVLGPWGLRPLEP